MKTIIKTTTSRTEFFNGIAQPVVTAIWSDESQTTEAANSIKYVGGKFEHVVNPTIRIKAIWTQYGPRYQHAGRNTDCVGDTDSWTIAAFSLAKWIEWNHPGCVPEFYGASAKSAKEGWADAWQK